MRKINNMIRTQFPNFIREGNHEKFVAFLQAYYDFLEKEGKPNNILAIYNEINDVDKTLEPFLRNFVESFAFAIPSRFFASKRDALKHFKEINSIKGTPRSYELLFRFLYNELIEFYFPEIDILRTSAATWERKHIVAIQSDVFPDVFFETLRSVNSRFHVNGVRLVSRRYNAYYIEFAGESFEGFFDPEIDNLFWVPGFSIIERNTERVVSRHDHLHEAENALAQMPSNVRDQHFIRDNEVVTKAWNMRPFNAISGIRINNPGAGYEKDTEFVYTDGIHRASLVIDNVGVNGEIINLRIRSQSYMPAPRPTSMMPAPTVMPTYTVIPTPLATSEITHHGWLMSVEYLYFGTQAEIEFIYNPFFVYNQPAQESFNQPSGRSRLQDGVFYSPYTYVIKSGQSIDLWRDMVYKMLHPAGMAVFSQILIMSGAKAISADQGPAQIIMYLFNWEVQGGILYALQAIAETKTELRLVCVPSIYTRNVSSYENWKFIVPPYEGGHTFQGVHREDSETYYSIDLGVPPPPPGEFNTNVDFYENDKFIHSFFTIEYVEHMTIEQFDRPWEDQAKLRPGSFIRFNASGGP